tara:strand:- start:1588 stop:2067 length:480 start_codon:yes stop_codon:yes gene_type:complete
MNDFLSIVVERNDTSLTKSPICPYCNSEDMESKCHHQTLLACGKTDPNHHWHEYVCKSCKSMFTLEYKEDIVWYTNQDKKVLKGIPGCYETYVYTCSKCGGDVKRHNLDLVTGQETSMLSYQAGEDGKLIKGHRTIFSCDNCLVEIESDDEYFRCADVV